MAKRDIKKRSDKMKKSKKIEKVFNKKKDEWWKTKEKKREPE